MSSDYWVMSREAYLLLHAVHNRCRDAEHTRKAQKRARKAQRRRNNGRRL